ncbi:hypothetical protein K457DRAFT_211783 [Linnemannia elongata AG-77]|uniref:Uncharacterized protein n=1 Tax=Linnemannia elongata AG-77 TaxID=1314771 RepID=A0A197K716_9FUNG|nr:hypothetical protein K457DRAFT_211783 [Linnemannia elongata AG-77]
MVEESVSSPFFVILSVGFRCRSLNLPRVGFGRSSSSRFRVGQRLMVAFAFLSFGSCRLSLLRMGCEYSLLCHWRAPTIESSMAASTFTSRIITYVALFRCFGWVGQDTGYSLSSAFSYSSCVFFKPFPHDYRPLFHNASQRNRNWNH